MRLRPGRRDHGEDAAGARWAGVAGAGVLPAEGGAGEALEPRLVLRVRRRGGELQVEVRAGRVAGLADEPDLVRWVRGLP